MGRYIPATTRDRRGYKLLRQHLTPAQKRELGRTGIITVPGQHSTYAISLFPSGIVTGIVGHGNVCIAVRGRGYDLPPPDQALAMLLFIRADERAFRATANREGIYWPRRTRY